jgi:hypothetical protein
MTRSRKPTPPIYFTRRPAALAPRGPIRQGHISRSYYSDPTIRQNPAKHSLNSKWKSKHRRYDLPKPNAMA